LALSFLSYHFMIPLPSINGRMEALLDPLEGEQELFVRAVPGRGRSIQLLFGFLWHLDLR
jgi:hypothetical protein